MQHTHSIKKYRLHLLALGDVGGTLLLGLRLLGGDILSAIGIYDVRPNIAARYEQEMNQIRMPTAGHSLPPVETLTEAELFHCDLFVFCASASVPDVGEKVSDVRMAQLAANEKLVRIYAGMARARGYQGIFAIVSDPVDLLCQCAYYTSNRDAAGNWDGAGLLPAQVRGYGLGVMHARALYYAGQDARFHMYPTEGRAFGPHGAGLVIANSIAHYDDALSVELTQLTVSANLRMRELGFKPYIAPAISSGAMPLLATLRGEWHYAAIYEDGIYFGCYNRRVDGKDEAEQIALPPALLARIAEAKIWLHEQGARWREA